MQLEAPPISYVTDPFKGMDEVRAAGENKTQQNVQQHQQNLQKREQEKMTAMPKQADAFLEGFVIRCGDMDSQSVAGMLEKAANDPRLNTTYRDLLLRPLIMAALGGSVGAGGGYLAGFNPLVTGAAGAGIGYGLSDKTIEDKKTGEAPPAE